MARKAEATKGDPRAKLARGAGSESVASGVERKDTVGFGGVHTAEGWPINADTARVEIGGAAPIDVDGDDLAFR